MTEMIPKIKQMTNQKRREAFEKAARDLGCDESDDARDRAAGKVLKPAKPKVGEAYGVAFPGGG